MHNIVAEGSGGKKDDVWVLVNGRVFDLTKFFRNHPGGHDIIEEYAGKDATKVFEDAGHPKSSIKEMEGYLIGEYVEPRQFTKLEDISDHNRAGDLWLLIHNKIYDVSKFKHPGKIFKVIKRNIRWCRKPYLKLSHGCNNLVRRY